MAVSCALETALLSGNHTVLPHQSGGPPPADGKPLILQFPCHSRATKCPFLHWEG